jgi:uracil-DNA glycosylase
MSYKQIYEIQEEWDGCVACPLGEKGPGNQVCIGSGNTEAIGLLITPWPVFKNNAAPYERGTPEADALTKIWAKADIDPAQWYHTSTVACPPLRHEPPVGMEFVEGLEFDEIEACKQRLCDIVLAISPAVVVLSGIEALDAWYGDVHEPSMPYGPIPHEHYKIVYTYDLHRFLEGKDKISPEEAKMKSQKILNHWKNIAKIITDL